MENIYNNIDSADIYPSLKEDKILKDKKNQINGLIDSYKKDLNEKELFMKDGISLSVLNKIKMKHVEKLNASLTNSDSVRSRFLKENGEIDFVEIEKFVKSIGEVKSSSLVFNPSIGRVDVANFKIKTFNTRSIVLKRDRSFFFSKNIIFFFIISVSLLVFLN